MKTLSFAAATIVGLGVASALASEPAPAAQSGLPTSVKNGTIGYVLTDRHWAVYQSPGGKVECPNGFNDGPREQFKVLFPEGKKKWTLLETQLKREGDIWFPVKDEDPRIPFKDSVGKIAYGMNLDGKVKPSDYTGTDGEKGVDNQLYRVLGCVANYRAPDGNNYDLENEYIRRYNQNRFMIEITGVDSLTNDDDVTVKSYRGLETLLTDATGQAFIPGGTQHVDERWGKFAQSTWKGKIVNGVLTTEPADLILPASATFVTSAVHKLKGYRFRLKLTPEHAEGIMAGYADVEGWAHHLKTSWSTHLQSYGQLSTASVYRAMRRLADGYPDPKTGEMTAISSTLDVKFTQAYIVHPAAQTVEGPPTTLRVSEPAR